LKKKEKSCIELRTIVVNGLVEIHKKLYLNKKWAKKINFKKFDNAVLDIDCFMKAAILIERDSRQRKTNETKK